MSLHKHNTAAGIRRQRADRIRIVILDRDRHGGGGDTVFPVIRPCDAMGDGGAIIIRIRILGRCRRSPAGPCSSPPP